ncbi:hypothetical protein CHU98_g10364 [Xylaria longipes]|nr:hypothetical protein CHU98_g10364 [Xylaria longipes]
MHFRQVLAKIGNASQRAGAHRELSGGRESLLAAAAPMDGLRHDSSELPSYEVLPPPPEYRATNPQSPAPTASFVRRLANKFSRRPSTKKPEPVSPEHQATLDQIERAVAEINLSHELQAATARQRALESTWDIAQETCTPSDLNDEFDERMDIAQHTEALYNRLVAIIGTDIGPQMCLPGARGPTSSAKSLRICARSSPCNSIWPNARTRPNAAGGPRPALNIRG